MRRADGVLEHIGVIGNAVDGENLRSFGELGLEGRAVPDDLRSACRPCGVLVVDLDADGVQQVDAFALLLGRGLIVARRVGVHQLVAAALKAIQRRGLADGIQPLAQECRPVIRLDGVQRLDHVVEGVGRRRYEAAVIDAEESAGEVIQRARALRVLADQVSASSQISAASL